MTNDSWDAAKVWREFYNSDGSLNRRAFSCGYVHVEDFGRMTIELYAAPALVCYFVTLRDDDREGWFYRQSFPSLSAAKEYIRKAKRGWQQTLVECMAEVQGKPGRR